MTRRGQQQGRETNALCPHQQETLFKYCKEDEHCRLIFYPSPPITSPTNHSFVSSNTQQQKDTTVVHYCHLRNATAHIYIIQHCACERVRERQTDRQMFHMCGLALKKSSESLRSGKCPSGHEASHGLPPYYYNKKNLYNISGCYNHEPSHAQNASRHFNGTSPAVVLGRLLYGLRTYKK